MLGSKKKIIRLFRVASTILLATISLLPGSVAAATSPSSNITTSPITLDVTVKPGQTVTSTLQMENNSSRPVAISMELKTFKANGSSGQAVIETPSPNDPSPSWVHFSQNNFTAQPGVWTPVQMTISLPKDADLGYYYAVLFKPVLPTNGSKNTNSVTLSNAVLVLVDTGSTNEVRQLQVSSLTTNRSIYEYLPVNFSITVHNPGNIYLAPEGSLYISKNANFSHVLASLNINKPGGRVLPDSSRVFSLQWQDGFPVFQPKTIAGQPVLNKHNQPVEQLHWDFSNIDHLRFGKYYARMALVYNNGERDVPIYGVVSFWVIPWKLILIVLFIILVQIALVITVLRYRHMYRKSRGVTKETPK
jgi:hypothetical protein